MIPEKDRERIIKIIEKEGVVKHENSYYEDYIMFIFNSFLYKKMLLDEELKECKEILYREFRIKQLLDITNKPIKKFKEMMQIQSKIKQTEKEFKILGMKNRIIKTKLSLNDIEKLKLLRVYNIELDELLRMILKFKR